MKTMVILLFVILKTSFGIAQSSLDYFYYKVQKTDKSLWAICHHFSAQMDEVKRLSKKSTDVIYVGERLKIPAKGFVVHQVSLKDKSLWRISQRYNINYQSILAFNRKSDAIIRTGEYLVFPKKWMPQHRESESYSNMFSYQGATYQVHVDIEKGDISRITLSLYVRKEGKWLLVDREQNIEATSSKYYLKKEKVFKDLNGDGILDLRFLDKANQRYQRYQLLFPAAQFKRL